MRAGKNVDLVDEPNADGRTDQEPSARIPPHTPPTANVVSSGPVAAATPKPDDAAAQSGAHAKSGEPGDKPTDKPTDLSDKPGTAKPPATKPESSGLAMYIILGLLLIAGVLIYVFVVNK